MRRGAAAAVLLLAAVGCEVAVARSTGLPGGRGRLLLEILGWLACGSAAAVTVGGRRLAHGAWVVVGVALVTQTLALTAGPQLSEDLYRYTWDARVADAGLSVYDLPPESPMLAAARDDYLWPSPAVCAETRSDFPAWSRHDPFAVAPRPPGCTLINRADDRTIYPPTAQLAFRAANTLTPEGWHELKVELPAALCSLAVTALLIGLLRRQGAGPGWALLYAATPLSGLEAGMDGHIDVLAALLVLGVLAVPRAQRWAGLVVSGALLGAVVLVKLYPALFAPAVLRRWSTRRAQLVVAGAATVTGIALYLPYVLQSGVRVLGYLPGYLSEEHYDSSSRYVLLRHLHLGALTAPLIAAIVGGVLLVQLRRPRERQDVEQVARAAALALGLAMLLASPGEAWYGVPLVALAALARRPEWVTVVAAQYVVYVDALLGWRSVWPTAAHVVAALTVIVSALFRRQLTLGKPLPARQTQP